MLRGRGLAPEDRRSKGMLGLGGRTPPSGVGTGRTSNLKGPWSEGTRGLSSILPEGMSGDARSLRPPPLPGRGARPARAPTWPPAAAASRATSQPSVRSPPWTQSRCWRRAGRATTRRSAGAAAAPSRLGPAPWSAEGSARRHATVYATLRSTPPGAPPPTSGGGSCSPLLGQSWACACVAGEVQEHSLGSPRVDAGSFAVAVPL